MTAGSHAFPGIHDPQMLGRAVDVEVLARRTESGIDVDVELRCADIGHAFPTGDVFRRAVLRVRTPGGAEDELELQRWLARTTDPDGEDMHVRTVDDTRVPATGVLQETLQLPDDEIHPVMAIQSLDRGRAVHALQEVRRLHDTYAPPESRPHPMAVDVEDAAYARPLGRLEKIDLEKAAAHRRDLRAKAEKRARNEAARHRSA